MWLSGDYKNGVSTMDRTLARVLEAKKADGDHPDAAWTILYRTPGVQQEDDVPDEARGAGLTDTTRGLWAIG
jgi:hydrogenase large subunit